jgi:hypothetical protein
MTDLNRTNCDNLDAYVETTGTAVPANRTMTGTDIRVLGCTLASGTTYYFPFAAQHGPVPAEVSCLTAQVWWNAAITITSITVETTTWPATFLAADPRGPVQLSDFAATTGATAGYWLLQNPPGAYVPITGGAAVAMTVSPTATTQGGCEFDISNLGNRRARIKVVVGATGGVVRVGVWGKAPS